MHEADGVAHATASTWFIAAMSRIWNAITATKNALGNLLFLVIITFIAVALFMGDRTEVPTRGALVLDPSGVLVEERQLTDPLAEILGTGGGNETRTRDVIEALKLASTDPRITHVVLDLNDLQGGSVAALLEIGDAIDNVRAAGKPVLTWESSYTQAQYLLAAHADEVFLDARGLNPLGPVFLTGLGVYPTFYRSALEKLQVQVHVFRAGLYKSAVEPYLRDTMSEASRQETQVWLGELWAQYLGRVASRRQIDERALEQYSANYATLLETASTPHHVALDAGLIDAVLTPAEWRDHLRLELGGAIGASNSIRMRAYLTASRSPLPVDPAAGANSVAVITMSGVILDGAQPPGAIGSASVRPLLERARKNPGIKALVVRVDSPGGSAAASEEIRAGLAAVQDAGKPVVVSMAGTAASGGYWLASTANRIFAAPATITGSIGTFITFPTFEASLAAVGVNSDGVGTTPLAGALDPFRALNPIVRQTLQASVAHTYARFTGLVTEGRNLDPGAVEALAQGRVFSGASALDAGLVDALGNLSDAIESAAQLAGAEDYTVSHLERELSPRELLLREISRVSLRLGIVASDAAGGEMAASLRQLARNAGELARFASDAAEMRGSLHVRCITCEVRL